MQCGNRCDGRNYHCPGAATCGLRASRMRNHVPIHGASVRVEHASRPINIGIFKNLTLVSKVLMLVEAHRPGTTFSDVVANCKEGFSTLRSVEKRRDESTLVSRSMDQLKFKRQLTALPERSYQLGSAGVEVQ